MRLIVTYTVGDGCTYSCDQVVPFECESAEQLLLDIEAKVTFALDYLVRQQAAWNKFHATWEMPPTGTKKFEEWWEAREVISQSFPYLSEEQTIITVGHSRLYTEHFIENGVFYAPTIMTVDEWFASEGL